MRCCSSPPNGRQTGSLDGPRTGSRWHFIPIGMGIGTCGFCQVAEERLGSSRLTRGPIGIPPGHRMGRRFSSNLPAWHRRHMGCVTRYRGAVAIGSKRSVGHTTRAVAGWAVGGLSVKSFGTERGLAGSGRRGRGRAADNDSRAPSAMVEGRARSLFLAGWAILGLDACRSL